jgi:EAL domain-containing protein (putative c-di-GMP-specific phosphodiesterase class I)
MARSIPLTVSAKGVESVEQQNFLLSCRCTVGQGPLFGEGLSEKEVGCLLRSENQRAGMKRIAH